MTIRDRLNDGRDGVVTAVESKVSARDVDHSPEQVLSSTDSISEVVRVYFNVGKVVIF